MFPTSYEDIEQRLVSIDPVRYGFTRNFADGAVTRLGPYVSRGVISTKQILDHIVSLGLPNRGTEKLIQELAWRDYWQQVWIAKKDGIDSDLKHQQLRVTNHEVPWAVMNAQTGIDAIDKGIKELKRTGYMHNHMRMYVASLTCNIAQSHWKQSARWMYSHLLDGDWASNALSWQWVAGTNAHKKYYANQQNINKYFHSQQRNTCLDVPYSDFDSLPLPDQFIRTVAFSFITVLPESERIDANKKTLIYNYYNLDPNWHGHDDVQRVLLVEPSFFEKYPVSQKCMDFMLALAKNICDIKIFSGEFDQLEQLVSENLLVYKEHPTNAHYRGQVESRDWMFDVKGYYPSFFAFWKLCKKQLHQT